MRCEVAQLVLHPCRAGARSTSQGDGWSGAAQGLSTRSQRGKLVCALCACSSCVCSGRPTRAHLSFIHSPPHSCRVQARLCWPSTARSTQVPNYSEELYYRQRRPEPAGPSRTCTSAARASWPGCPSIGIRALQEAMVAGRRGSEGAGGAGMGWRGGVRRSGGLNQAGGAGAGARRRSGGLARSRSRRRGSVAIY